MTAFARALESAARAGTLQDNTPPPSDNNTKSSESKERMYRYLLICKKLIKMFNIAICFENTIR